MELHRYRGRGYSSFERVNCAYGCRVDLLRVGELWVSGLATANGRTRDVWLCKRLKSG